MNVVIDGKIMDDCLKSTGNNEIWLKKELSRQNVKLKDLILATCDRDNKLTVFKKTDTMKDADIFI